MKERARCGITILFGLMLLVPAASGSFADTGDPVRRKSLEVSDTLLPYPSEEWIVSPDEEEIGTYDRPECDIQSIISCFDETYLRIDLLLNNGVTEGNDAFYAVKLDYETMTEYFTFYTGTGRLVYEKEKNGQIVSRKTISDADSSVTAGVISVVTQNDDVFFLLEKSSRINGEKGKRYFVTLTCYSGYVADGKTPKLEDRTRAVDVEFKL